MLTFTLEVNLLFFADSSAPIVGSKEHRCAVCHVLDWETHWIVVLEAVQLLGKDYLWHLVDKVLPDFWALLWFLVAVSSSSFFLEE